MKSTYQSRMKPISTRLLQEDVAALLDLRKSYQGDGRIGQCPLCKIGGCWECPWQYIEQITCIDFATTHGISIVRISMFPDKYSEIVKKRLVLITKHLKIIRKEIRRRTA